MTIKTDYIFYACHSKLAYSQVSGSVSMLIINWRKEPFIRAGSEAKLNNSEHELCFIW